MLNIFAKVLLGIVVMESMFSCSCYAEQNENPFWNSKIEEYSNKDDVHSLIFVKYKEKSDAKIILYKKDQNKQFKELLNINGFVGKNGLGKEKEGDSKTPIGDFGIINAFGIKPNPGTSLEYLNINEYHYCCDENCKFYNKIIDSKQENHDCKGEHIIKYVPQYNYAIFIDYNKECVFPKGSAIFMHCVGRKPYTAGCVSVSENNMINILKEIDANTRVCINWEGER